jgi:hypothetical protein
MKRISAVPFLIVLFFFFAAVVRAETLSELPAVTGPDQAFVTGALVAKGEGAAPSDRSLTSGQRRILALRAAKVVALREVAEIVDGVLVNGETAIVNASVESDVVRATVQGLIKGAQVINEVYDPVSEMATVYISVPMTGPDGLITRLLPDVTPMVPTGPYYQPPAGAASAGFDGLIIDVRSHPFRPALINRVVARNGETIYDPTKVAQDILVERGAAEYTNDVGKARALLGERGAANPAVVKAGGVIRSTDVVVEPEDATAIYASNQAKSFLEGAKVVFVLK